MASAQWLLTRAAGNESRIQDIRCKPATRKTARSPGSRLRATRASGAFLHCRHARAQAVTKGAASPVPPAARATHQSRAACSAPRLRNVRMRGSPPGLLFPSRPR
jgi:hypothetical protein